MVIKWDTDSNTGFPGGAVVKNPPANARDAGSSPGSGRSPGGGNGYPLQYSCLENSVDRRSLEGYSPWVGHNLKTEHAPVRICTTYKISFKYLFY